MNSEFQIVVYCVVIEMNCYISMINIVNKIQNIELLLDLHVEFKSCEVYITYFLSLCTVILYIYVYVLI